jgi:hypothetical protein
MTQTTAAAIYVACVRKKSWKTGNFPKQPIYMLVNVYDIMNEWFKWKYEGKEWGYEGISECNLLLYLRISR